MPRPRKRPPNMPDLSTPQARAAVAAGDLADTGVTVLRLLHQHGPVLAEDDLDRLALALWQALQPVSDALWRAGRAVQAAHRQARAEARPRVRAAFRSGLKRGRYTARTPAVQGDCDGTGPELDAQGRGQGHPVAEYPVALTPERRD
jgi:hypothetical protein